MHETGNKLFNLMFRPGERVCVSVDKFGYHSVPLENALSEKVTLVSPNGNVPARIVNSDDLTLVALNPMGHGYRTDENVCAYRNFLLELDTSSIATQIEYIKKLGIPYSTIVFSGSKSAHTVVSLSQDLPNEKIYRDFAEWMLNIYTFCDQAIKNPSRSTRIPGAMREGGKQQELLEYRGPVKTADLINWLKLHPNAKPKERQLAKRSEKPNIDRIKPWVAKKLIDASNLLISNRNRTWYSISIEFSLAGYSEEEIIFILEKYFVEQRDFTRREWLTTIKSGIKTVLSR
jgi:hypothetical protein